MDQLEITEALGGVYAVVANEFGTGIALGTPRASPRTLRWAFDQYFISWPLQDLTNPE